jgi:hypothetical protein
MYSARDGLLASREKLAPLSGILARHRGAVKQRTDRPGPGSPLTPPPEGEGDYRGVNMGTDGPPSLGVHTTRTGWPLRSASKSQSTRLVIMVGPSSSVT